MQSSPHCQAYRLKFSCRLSCRQAVLFSHKHHSTTLLRAFDENVVQQVKAKLAAVSSGKSQEPLLPTILVLVYIEMQFQEHVELLELVINKAKKWLEKTIPREQEEIFWIARGGFLVSR